MTMLARLRAHWREYLIEGWALGTFMISAAVVATIFESPASPVRQAIGEPLLRHLLEGVAMGLTAVALIYSRWGKRSGAHMNPAITLSFLRLGKIDRIDALFYVIAQFVGGTAGVVIAAAFLGSAFTAEPVNYAVTVPGEAGSAIAFGAEWLISLLMFVSVLWFSNHDRYAALTGVAAGFLVALFITVESPLSGMSMNPARSFASAAPDGISSGLWLYFVAPVLGMLAAADGYTRLGARRRVQCAKLLHPADVPCIHCGYRPQRRGIDSSTQAVENTL